MNRKDLVKLRRKIEQCKKCNLYKTAANKVIGKGSLQPKVLFVGEAPGVEEDSTGIPFVGRSGKLLDRWIKFLNLSKKDYAVTNILKCRPPNNRDPEESEIKACLPFLAEQIRKLNPEIIVTLGKFATQTLLKDKTKPVSQCVGKKFSVNGFDIFPLFHPAYYLRKNIVGKTAELKTLKEILSQDRKTFLDSFSINIQHCEDLSLQEMISPILCGVHHFCRQAKISFKDINQHDVCMIDGKMTQLNRFEQTNEIDLFLEDLSETGKYSNIERFVFYVRERGKFEFIGYIDRKEVDALPDAFHFKAKKPCKKIMYDTLLSMSDIWKIEADKKESISREIQPFVHLHAHSQYSIGDAYGNADDIAEAVWRKGFTAHAITDHGTLAGTLYLQKALRKRGIKPILGIEAYVVENDKKEHSQHAVLLVKNEKGWKTLLHLHNSAVRNNFYRKPKIFLRELLENHEGLILTSACVNGIVNSKIEDFEKAKERVKLLKEAFGDDFYLEVMPHEKVPNQIEYNKRNLMLAEEFNIKVIITCDVHYPEKEDKKVHDAVKAIALRKKYGEAGYSGNTFYLMTYKEIREHLKKHMPFMVEKLDEMFANTLEISKKCNFFIKPLIGNTLPKIFDNENEKIRELAYLGLKKIKKDKDKKYVKQLEFELKRIIEKDYSRYFLVVKDYIDWCKQNNIMIGPGRGSVGASLLAYCLGITQVDPIKYDLMFDRFISPIRKDFPDIDMDFEDSKRKKLFDYLTSRYGEKNIAGIVTYSTWRGKGSLRDIGRIFNFPFKEIDKLCSLVITRSGGDARADYCLEDTFSEFEQGKKFKKEHPEESEIAIRLESRVRHRGVHAAGKIICNQSLDHYVPIAKVHDVIVAEWEKELIEEIGLIKFDILGLKTLTIIKETIDKINNFPGLPTTFDDSKVFDSVFKNGNTLGVFQFETVGLQKLSKQLAIDNFEMLYNATTLYRPGPLHSGQTADFVLRHLKKKDWVFDHPLLEPLTKETYGLILYQEQVMKIMHDLGGFSWATSESARKIMSKSKGKKEFEKMRNEFILNANREHNIPKSESGKIFDVVSTFGSYGFNKTHAVEYSIISYWTAWLKTYYPTEFFATLLSHEGDGKKCKDYIRDAKRLGIKVELPEINYSGVGHKVLRDRIFLGFDSIKGIGKSIAKKITKYQPYSDLWDFIEKVKPGKSLLQALTISGCFRKMDIGDKTLFDKAEEILKKKRNITFSLKEDSFSEKERILLREQYLSFPSEKSLISFFNNPFREKVKISKIEELVFDDYNEDIWIEGIVTFINFKQEGLEGQWTMFDNVLERRYAHLNVSDGTGNVLVHFSPEQYTYYKKYFERKVGFPVLIYGHSIPNYNKIYCDGMIVLDQIDYNNPLLNIIMAKKEKIQNVLERLKSKFPECEVGIIKKVNYKVSKNKNPYARIEIQNKKDSLLCFGLDSDIFIAGEFIVYKQNAPPFIQVIARKKRIKENFYEIQK